METNDVFGQITALMERCKQLELVNETQWLLINNMEKNLKEQNDTIKKLVTYMLSSEQNFATLAHQNAVLHNIIDALSERLNHGIT